MQTLYIDIDGRVGGKVVGAVSQSETLGAEASGLGDEYDRTI